MIDLGVAIDFGDWEIPISYAESQDIEPEYDRGNYVEPNRKNSTIRGKIQPVSGRDLRDMKEGIREEAVMVLGTRATVQIDDEVTDIRDGRKYKVIMASPSTIGGNRTRAVLGKLKSK